MGKNFFVFIVLSISAFSARAGNPPSMIDKAVACIKEWEGWHRGQLPYIGYGHNYPNLDIILTLYSK